MGDESAVSGLFRDYYQWDKALEVNGFGDIERKVTELNEDLSRLKLEIQARNDEVKILTAHIASYKKEIARVTKSCKTERIHLNDAFVAADLTYHIKPSDHPFHPKSF